MLGMVENSVASLGELSSSGAMAELLTKIGTIRTCYDEKFGVPRQPRLVVDAWGVIEFEHPYDDLAFFKGIEGFSHLWLLFQFHQVDAKQVRATVRPPRLGGNQRVGAFATRSPYRPNRIGMSVVEFDRLEHAADGRVFLHVKGVDLVDKTPIFDIKPYIPFSDSVPEAQGGFVDGKPALLEVVWQCDGPSELRERRVIQQSLALDPRPAYHESEEREYGSTMAGWRLRWKVESGVLYVLSAECSE